MLRRLKTTLQLTGGALLGSGLALALLLGAAPDAERAARRAPQVTPTGVIFSDQVGPRAG